MPRLKKFYVLCIPLLLSLLATLTYAVSKTIGWDNKWQLVCAAAAAALVALGASARLGDRAKASPAGPSSILIMICILSAAALRYYGADFGLPEYYHPDEPRKAEIALRMAQTGDLNPNYFLHPTLLLYLTTGWGKLGMILGVVSNLDLPTMLYSGRLVSATAGAATVLILFLLGRTLSGSSTGLWAAALLTVIPLHVTCSRYLKEDALLTFFVLTVIWLCVRAVDLDRPRSLLWAGFVAGLATSSKYSGLLSCTAIALVPWLKSGSLIPDYRFFRWGLLSALCVPLGFLTGSPYALLNYPKFLADLNEERSHMIAGHRGLVISGWSQYWAFHLSRSIGPGLTWPLTALSLFGCGHMARRAGPRGLYIVALLTLFYYSAEAINSKPSPQPERYILPCIPLLVLGAAFALEHCRFFQWSRPVLGLLVLLVPLYRSLGLASELTPDTRTLMRDWITQNIPADKKILTATEPYLAQRSYTVRLPESYTPSWANPRRQELTYENLRTNGVDYVLLSTMSYDRYFQTRSTNSVLRSRYEAILQGWVLVKDIQADFGTYGFSNPHLSLYKVELRDTTDTTLTGPAP